MSPGPSTRGLQFAVSLSTAADTAQAVAEVCHTGGRSLGGDADLALVFASPHHAPQLEQLASEIGQRSGARHLLGCIGESIVGGPHEIEEAPAIALWMARLPGASIQPMHLNFERTAEGNTYVGWPDDLPASWPAGSALLLLGDPFTFPADVLLERLNEDQPGTPVIGGMAGGMDRGGEKRLILEGRVLTRGAVGALIHGPLKIRAVVSQGCRPIGRHYVVTKAEQNVIYELSGKPPLAHLQEVFDALPASEQNLVQRGLHVGLAINEYQDRFGRGDFIIRNCIGADRQTGAIAIADYVRVGQTVQFQVRDAQTADEDLRSRLKSAEQSGDPVPQGALLFTCNGRGTSLFDQPHHDAGAIGDVFGQIPLAGFFANGELGPVGGKNHVHGFTASVALFSPAE